VLISSKQRQKKKSSEKQGTYFGGSKSGCEPSPREPTKASLSTAVEVMSEPCRFIPEGQKWEGRKGSKTIQDVDHESDFAASANISSLLFVEEDPWLKDLNEYFTDLCGQTNDVAVEGGNIAQKKSCRVDPMRELPAGGTSKKVCKVEPYYPLGGETLEALDLQLPEHLQCLESSRACGRLLSHNVKTQPLKVQPADPRRYHHARNVKIINEKLAAVAAKNANSSPQLRRTDLSVFLKCALERMPGFPRTMARGKPNSKGFFSAMGSYARQKFASSGTTLRSDRSCISPREAPRTSSLTAGASTSASRDIKFVEFANLSIEEKMRAYCGYFDNLEQEQKMYVCPPAAYFDILMKETSAIPSCKASLPVGSRTISYP